MVQGQLPWKATGLMLLRGERRDKELGRRSRRRQQLLAAPPVSAQCLFWSPYAAASFSVELFKLLFLFLSRNMKVTIKEWNAVASWRWNMPEDEVCGICRVQFDGTCPTCKFPGDDCSLCMSRTDFHLTFAYILTIFLANSTRKMRSFFPHGSLSPPFPASPHAADLINEQHCLLTWIQQESSKGLCPMCRQSESLLV